MSFLHTDPAPLERLLRRVFRLGDHRCCLRQAGLLCKPFICHHFCVQTFTRPEISFRAGFRHRGNTLSCQKKQRKNSVTQRKTDYGASLSRQSFCRSARPFRAVSGTKDTFASSLRYHHRKLYPQIGRAKIIDLFHAFFQ